MRTKEIKNLLAKMSLSEKIDQMLQLIGTFYQKNIEEILTGPARDLGVSDEEINQAGSILGTAGAEQLIQLQKKYMEKQPHHIPMLFMMDIIHGMRTIFPIPLAQGATFDPDMAERCAAAMAKEAAVSGLHVTFAPMVDLVRDARWGRVMESTGEDPYLNSLFAEAMVKGLQGENMGAPYKISACIKHFAAYGAVTAGRDYNTVELSEHTLREFYFPAYQAGINTGAGMVMTSFNTVNGIPATVNKWLMRDVLRKEMGFDGVLISDFAAILETIDHGCAVDGKDAARKALEAGVDIDMMTNVYATYLVQLIQEGQVEESMVDESVLRILELKNKLGLFENPYKDADPEKEKTVLLCRKHRELARDMAGMSFVLLKNEEILPVDTGKKIAFIGPYTNCKELISTWAITGSSEDCVSIEDAAREIFDPEIVSFCQGSPMLGSDVSMSDIVYSGKDGWEDVTEEEQKCMLEEAVEAAKKAEVVIMPIGEYYLQSGEATSRGMIDLPQVQMHLLREIAKVNENIVVVLFNGRPLDLREISHMSKAILEVWLPGTEGGHAIIDVLTGKVNPSGKLPMSFPYCVGQVPVHYNEYTTGRPALSGLQDRFRSRYIDIPNKPLYPFGYGLSYTEFEISPVSLDGDVVTEDTSVIAKVQVKNKGNVKGTQTLQLYIQDVVASVVRPVKELKGIRKVTLEPGEKKEAAFRINESMLRFVKANGEVGSEAGEFFLWIGDSSETGNKSRFYLK